MGKSIYCLVFPQVSPRAQTGSNLRRSGQTASGEWIVRSGNDGGRVRERPRSVAGAVFRI